MSAVDTICDGCGLLTGSTDAWLRHTRQCARGAPLNIADEASHARLVAEREALLEVYAVAARLRQFPVPFDDHWALVGAVDECRSVLDPPVDDHAPSGWQEHVAAHPREEFLAAFREAHAALHRLWTAAVGKEGYDKATWKTVDNALARFARDASEKVGVRHGEPLL